MMIEKINKYGNGHYILKYNLILQYFNKLDKKDKPLFETILKFCGKDIEKSFGIDILIVDPKTEFVHIVFYANPTTNLSKLVNTFKTKVSRTIKSEYKKLQKNEQQFWTNEYYLFSSDEFNLEEFKKYLQRNKKIFKH